MKLYRPVTVEEINKEIQNLGLPFQLSRQLNFERAFDKMTNDNYKEFDNIQERTEEQFEELIKAEKVEEAYELIRNYIPYYGDLPEQLEQLLLLSKAKKDVENGTVIYTDYFFD